LQKSTSSIEIKDLYGEITKLYPMAWNALVQLGKCIGKKVVYTNITKKENNATKEFNLRFKKIENMETKKTIREVQSGISEEINVELMNFLATIIQRECMVFYVDCFKMISRNLRKLLLVMEILLENNDYILTSNYLITNSYIGKRMEVLRAAHTKNEPVEKMSSSEFLCGLSKLHREVLEGYINAK